MSKPKKDKRSLSFKLDEEFCLKLDEINDIEHWTMTQTLTEAVKLFLASRNL